MLAPLTIKIDFRVTHSVKTLGARFCLGCEVRTVLFAETKECTIALLHLLVGASVTGADREVASRTPIPIDSLRFPRTDHESAALATPGQGLLAGLGPAGLGHPCHWFKNGFDRSVSHGANGIRAGSQSTTVS